jgi:hypothetical protein
VRRWMKSGMKWLVRRGIERDSHLPIFAETEQTLRLRVAFLRRHYGGASYMRTIPIVLLVLLGTAIAQDAPRLVEQFSPDPSQVFHLDLDTAAGSLSQWRHDVIDPLSALRAKVRIPMMRPGPQWSPTFSLWLQKNGTEQKHNRVTLQFFTPNQKPPLFIRILRVDDGKMVVNETTESTVDLGDTLNVEMSWKTPNTLMIKLGDSERIKIAIPWVIESIGVSASSGEMEVDPLVLGTVGH